jgi:ankyrin repeat protein
VSLLLSLGADATRRDTSGKTALDAAVKRAEGGRAASHAHLKEISKRLNPTCCQRRANNMRVLF